MGQSSATVVAIGDDAVAITCTHQPIRLIVTLSDHVGQGLAIILCPLPRGHCVRFGVGLRCICICQLGVQIFVSSQCRGELRHDRWVIMKMLI